MFGESVARVAVAVAGGVMLSLSRLLCRYKHWASEIIKLAAWDRRDDEKGVDVGFQGALPGPVLLASRKRGPRHVSPASLCILARYYMAW